MEDSFIELKDGADGKGRAFLRTTVEEVDGRRIHTLKGSSSDGGPEWVSRVGVDGVNPVASSDPTGEGVALTPNAPSGKQFVITDIFISSDTAMLLTFGNDGNDWLKVYIGANETKQITPRGRLGVIGGETGLRVYSDVPGNLSISPIYYEENED